MMEAYKVACYKYANIVANEGISISYQSKTYQARRCNAKTRRLQCKQKAMQDKTNEFGPPDKQCHFEHKQNTDKTTVRVDDNVVSIHSNLHPEVIGKRVQMRMEAPIGIKD